jgi:hypothetical protein
MAVVKCSVGPLCLSMGFCTRLSSSGCITGFPEVSVAELYRSLAGRLGKHKVSTQSFRRFALLIESTTLPCNQGTSSLVPIGASVHAGFQPLRRCLLQKQEAPRSGAPAEATACPERSALGAKSNGAFRPWNKLPNRIGALVPA